MTAVESEPSNLEELLDRLGDAENASSDEQVSVEDLVEATGRRSFAPLLLVAGLLVASPLSGIPGLPTFTAALVALIAVQLLLRRRSFWLPEWLLRRKFSQSKLDKALRFLRPPARWIDKLLRPRLTALTKGPFVLVIGVFCGLLALTMPPLEFVPFASSVVGTVLAIFGLALVSHDGLLVLLGAAICAIGLVVALGLL